MTPGVEEIRARFRRWSGVILTVIPLVALMAVLSVAAYAADGGGTDAEVPGADPGVQAPASDRGTIVLGAAIVMAAALLATGYAVATVGSAALGAASEKPELIVRALVFVALAEGIAVWGLIVAVMLIGKM